VTTRVLHIATVAGRPLRFFQTPLEDGRPDLVWHAIDDLQQCLGLNREQRKAYQRLLRSHTKRWSTIPRTVATADGLVTIAPHFMAQGMVDAMVEERIAPANARRDYDRASAEAQRKIPKPGPFGSDEWFAWMRAAMNRWDGGEPN
jgi:hypothetical protein